MRQGWFSALGNPKLAVFFVSLLPQFMPPGRASLPVLLGLGLSFSAMTLLWLAGCAVLVGRAGNLPVRLRLRRALEVGLGATLVALGVRVALERR
jgi:threonine/homoserine/homoserine lactone efflux protein